MEDASSAHWRVRLGDWIESPLPRNTIIGLIIINAIALGLETSEPVVRLFGDALKVLEVAILAVFVAEILAKLVAWDWRFFRNGWNVLDFAIVGISLVPAAGSLAILRSLRILRVLRLLSTVPRLRRLTESLLAAIPSIGWITLMLGLVFYIFAVIGTNLFGDTFPDWFGTLGRTLYTLFQVMTLESWSMGISRPVMQAYPWAWLYFVPFILVSAFTILNLFIGIIVSTMQATHWEEEEVKRLETEQQAHREREEMLALMQRMSERLERLEDRREP